jgi:hypothetical protein
MHNEKSLNTGTIGEVTPIPGDMPGLRVHRVGTAMLQAGIKSGPHGLINCIRR